MFPFTAIINQVLENTKTDKTDYRHYKKVHRQQSVKSSMSFRASVRLVNKKALLKQGFFL